MTQKSKLNDEILIVRSLQGNGRPFNTIIIMPAPQSFQQ